jgi:hypothetical protein
VGALPDMRRRQAELSDLAILSIATAFAIAGLVAYFVLTPIPPNTLVAFEHSLVSEPAAD